MNNSKWSTSGLRETAPYLGLGIQLAAVVLVSYFVGSWADGKFNTTPWLMLTGVTIGVVGGFWQFLRTVMDLTKKDSTKKRDGSP
jgi:ATP synthase protein I